MKVEVLPGSGLDAVVREAWERLRAEAGPQLASPFFSPAWVECVAAARDDVRIAIIERAGDVRGILPFQGTGLHARPVGGPLCDFQGLIGRVPAGHDLPELLARAGIGAFHYDHLLLHKDEVDPAAGGPPIDSPYMDLVGGLDAYIEERKAAGSKQIRQIQRKLRKLEREVGELRFEWDVRDPAVLERLFEWKALYYARQHTTDRFSHAWIREVVRNALGWREAGFQGLLSGLWAGDRLVAVHLGLRSETVLHYWFPTYDADYGRYSPGLGLLLELAARCCREGIGRLDLGRGDERYKASMASARLPIAEGCVTARSSRGRIVAGAQTARALVRDWPGIAQLARCTRSLREASRFT